MPYKTKKIDNKFEVVNTETGKVHSKGTTKKKKPASSYREFVKQQMAKRPSDVLAKDYMKEIGSKWREIKGRGTELLLSPGLGNTANFIQ